MEVKQNDLQILIKRYNTTIGDLEEQLSDVKRKRDMVYETLKLLESEGITTQDRLFKNENASIGGKYKNLRMKESVIDTFKSHPEDYLTGRYIYNELIKNGFQSNSKNIKRDVYIMLNKMKKDNIIIENTEGKLKRYKLAPRIVASRRSWIPEAHRGT